MKLIGILISFIFVLVTAFQEEAPVVITTNGILQGIVKESTYEFLGIPFAAPPIGELRWRSPRPHRVWNGIRMADRLGKSCIQDPNQSPKLETSEDCLYLNVYTPKQNSFLLPVMVWIYGGSFTSGSSTLYNATELVSQGNVVVVTINYRLGPFGFMALPALQEEDEFNSTGNYGIQDQRLALQWVQQNIINFGGDPNAVTIFGESAGACSVCIHLVTPTSFGLYSKALMESGFCNLVNTLETSVAISMNISSVVGCSIADLKCLRAVSAQNIYYANPSARFWPTLDGSEMSVQPIKSIREGKWNSVPLLAGTNLNEWGLFACPIYVNITTQQFENYVYQLYGQKVGQVLLSYYPPAKYPTPVQALVDLGSDEIFKCPTRQVLSAVVATNQTGYMYSFNHIPGYSQGPCYGVAHFYEVPFIFPQLLNYRNYTLSPQEKKLSDTMINYWTSYAKYGHLSNWPTYNNKEQPNIVFDFKIQDEEHYRQSYCQLWDEILH